jgi:peptide/nickel transport system substrate-binding protein
VKFHDGEAFDASDVKFSFERAKAEGSTNKAKKAVFDNISRVETPDPHTVIVVLNEADGNFLFRMGENTAVILDPKSAAGTATKPVGTGPFRFDNWAKGSAVTLVKFDGFRNAPAVKLKKVTFRFINDAAAQVAALLAGDIDGMPRFGALQSLKQFEGDPRFSVTAGGTEGKTIVSINNKKKPFDDVRVRRAIAAAIDRQAVIDGAQQGFGKPIGSHMVPSDAGYVDLTSVNPYNPEKAKALLKEAGVALPLNVTLTLPPPEYARKGGEIVAAQLAKVGIVAKIENVEWAQWLSGPFKGNFDLTVISHVEPLDFDRYADPAYYWGYDSKAYRELVARYNSTGDSQARLKLLGDIQKQLATDSVNAYLFQLPQFAVSKKNLKGLWSSSPIFANDMGAVSWQAK